MNTIEWIRPSKTKITTNDKPETIAYAKDAGWKRAPKKRTQPKKVDNNGNS